MQQEERFRALIREDLQQGPAPEPRIGDVLERARRRRRGRRLVFGALAVCLALALTLPLSLLTWIGNRGLGPAGGRVTERYGIHVELPRGWEGRFTISPGRGPVLVATNFPLRSWLPTGVTASFPFAPYMPASLEGGGPHAAVVSLFEYPPDRLSPSNGAFVPMHNPLTISSRDIKPCLLMMEGCIIRYLSVSGRNFLLIGTFATVEVTASSGVAVGHVRVVPQEVLAQANELLGSLTVETSGYQLGLSCEPHGTTLHLTTTTGGLIGWSPNCLAAPAGHRLTIHFENRLTTVRGKAGIYAGLELYPNEVFAYTIEDQAYGASSDTRRHAVFIGEEITSPGTRTYHIPPLAPGVYYVTGQAGNPTGLNGVLIVTD